MDCNRWREMASDFNEGALPETMRELMSRHIDTCVDCRETQDSVAALTRELNVLPSVDPPLFFRENVIAAIERQKLERRSGWQALFWGRDRAVSANVGRIALGTLLAGGAAAAVCWSVLLPGSSGALKRANMPAGLVAPLGGLLPGGSTSAMGARPDLQVTRVTTMTPGNGAAYDLSFWLVNADRGVANWRFVGDPKSYTFALSGNAPQTARVPYTAAQGKDTVALAVRWTADAVSHTRYLVLPVADAQIGAPVRVPDAHQSFALPEEGIVDAVRQVSGRFGVPVTLEDVPDSLRVVVTAQDESAAQAMKRSLAAAGVDVAESPAGIRMTPSANGIDIPSPAAP